MSAPWITDPGRYDDLPEVDYHADVVVGGSLSSTGARTLATKCPAKYLHDRDHGRADTEAFEFGRAYHAVLLGSGTEIVEVHAKTWRGKDAAAAAAEARAAGAVPLLSADVERIAEMVAVMRADPDAGPLLARPGRAEASYFARDEKTGVMRRARVDFEPTDIAPGARRVLVDAKTTRDAHPVAFAKSMGDFGYHQQGPWYEDVVSAAEPDDLPPPTFVLLAQEKTPPFLVLVATPDEEAAAWGRELNRLALDVYARCSATGHWPSYDRGPRGVAPLSLPGWRVATYEAALRRHHELIGASA